MKGERGKGKSEKGKSSKNSKPYWEGTSQWEEQKKAPPAPKRGEAPTRFTGAKLTGQGESLTRVIEEAEMILERLYHPNTCLVQDPETGCLPEAVELAQGGEAMINKAKKHRVERIKTLVPRYFKSSKTPV